MRDHAPVSALLYASIGALLASFMLLLAMAWLAVDRGACFCRARTRLVVAARAAQIAGALFCVEHSIRATDSGPSLAALAGDSLLFSPSFELIYAMLQRGMILWSCFTLAVTPLAFRTSLLLHTVGGVPLLLRAASALVPSLQDANVQPLVCDIANTIDRQYDRSTAYECYRMAPQRLLYSVRAARMRSSVAMLQLFSIATEPAVCHAVPASVY